MQNQVSDIIVVANPAVSAGLTVVDVDYDNALGAWSVLWETTFGATVTVSTATCFLQVFQADASDYSDAEEITDLKTAIVAGMASKKVYLEAIKPTKRYLRFRYNRAGSSNNIQIAGGALVAKVARVLPIALQSDDYSRTAKTCPASS